MNRYQPRIPTASALGVCQDTDASTVTYRKLPFDFKGYAKKLEANSIPIPLWLEDELERMDRNARESEKEEDTK